MREKVLFLVALLLVVPVATVVAFHPNDDCDRCHLPHEDVVEDGNTIGGLAGMPLWSGVKTLVAPSSFATYESATLDAEPGEPEGPTLVCLACHDTGKHGLNSVSGDLSGSHPMEFVYDIALADEDRELVNPVVGISNVVNGEGTIKGDLLNAGTQKLNCQSCHEIHVNGLHSEVVSPPDGTADFDLSIPHLVNMVGIEMTVSSRDDANDSANYELSYGVLCRTCHIK